MTSRVTPSECGHGIRAQRGFVEHDDGSSEWLMVCIDCGDVAAGSGGGR